MRRILLTVLLGVLPGFSPALAGGEIYGTITTVRGEKLTGPIRWDKNENLWDDFLDAEKDRRVRISHHGARISLFGEDLRDWIPGDAWGFSRFSIPFGHVRSIEPLSRSRVLLRLKNGEEIRVRAGGSTDLGEDMRGLVVDDRLKGKVDVKWGQVERIEFAQGSGAGRDAERLYGTVESRRGEFTGFIVWDRDEALREDVLDGEDRNGKRAIAFRDIKEIRRRDSRSCQVSPASGPPVVLRGTNDVNAENRGIQITVPGLGRVEVGWDEFQRVVFLDPPPSPRYADFDGGRRLSGTVTTADGRSHAGRIIWDDDEKYTWETLDGDADGVDYAILFENVRSIERASSRSAEVELRNGQVVVLTGSNDVDRENKGVRIVPASGEEIVLGWGEFQAVEFAEPQPRKR